MEKLFFNVVAELIANYLSNYTWIISGSIGMALGTILGRWWGRKEASTVESGRISFTNSPISPIININYLEKESDIKGAVLKCDFQLAIMYVTGRGMVDTLAPQVYIEKPDGTRLPVELKRVEVQEGKDKTRMFEIEPIPIEESSNSA